MAKSFSVENPDALSQLAGDLDALLSESAFRQTAAATATVFKDEVLARVPRDSGDLAGGLTVYYDAEDSVKGKIATYIVGFVGDTKTRYSTKRKVSRRALAGWIENGTSRMAPRSFVRAAYEAARTKASYVAQDKLSELASKGLNGDVKQ